MTAQFTRLTNRIIYAVNSIAMSVYFSLSIRVVINFELLPHAKNKCKSRFYISFLYKVHMKYLEQSNYKTFHLSFGRENLKVAVVPAHSLDDGLHGTSTSQNYSIKTHKTHENFHELRIELL